jgi:hypothetical protein
MPGRLESAATPLRETQILRLELLISLMKDNDFG